MSISALFENSEMHDTGEHVGCSALVRTVAIWLWGVIDPSSSYRSQEERMTARELMNW